LQLCKHLSVEQRQLALRLKARGLSLREIGPQVGCSHQSVALVVRQSSRRPVRHDGWLPGPGRLTLADREEITIGLHAGDSFTVIAARLGKAVWTVSREVAATGGRAGTGPGGRTSAPVSRPGGPRRPSWPARSWPPGSLPGWPGGGRRCRSRAGCGSSSRAIP
jgi:helix-turn-helix protein